MLAVEQPVEAAAAPPGLVPHDGELPATAPKPPPILFPVYTGADEMVMRFCDRVLRFTHDDLGIPALTDKRAN